MPKVNKFLIHKNKFDSNNLIQINYFMIFFEYILFKLFFAKGCEKQTIKLILVMKDLHSAHDSFPNSKLT